MPEPMPTMDNELPNVSDDALGKFIKTFKDQDEVGLETYGTYLQPFNGRVAANDAMEEAADLVKYMTQLNIENKMLLTFIIWCFENGRIDEHDMQPRLLNYIEDKRMLTDEEFHKYVDLVCVSL